MIVTIEIPDSWILKYYIQHMTEEHGYSIGWNMARKS